MADLNVKKNDTRSRKKRKEKNKEINKIFNNINLPIQTKVTTLFCNLLLCTNIRFTFIKNYVIFNKKNKIFSFPLFLKNKLIIRALKFF